MSDSDPEIPELLRDLTRELRRLQREVEPDRRVRPPTPGELSRFTSEVAIPGIILLLRTQIQALELLRRAIRLAEGRDPRGPEGGGEMRERAEKLGQVTLTQLDSVLGELQSAVEGRPDDDRAQELLAQAQKLRTQVQEEFEVDEQDIDGQELDGEELDSDDVVDIDVEAELRSLKDDMDDADETDSSDDGTDDTDSDDM